MYHRIHYTSANQTAYSMSYTHCKLDTQRAHPGALTHSTFTYSLQQCQQYPILALNGHIQTQNFPLKTFSEYKFHFSSYPQMTDDVCCTTAYTESLQMPQQSTNGRIPQLGTERSHNSAVSNRSQILMMPTSEFILANQNIGYAGLTILISW